MSGRRNFWVPVICGATILTIGIGARQSFGIFQKPIAADLNVGRELWSFGTALAMLLMGVFSPFVGNLADRQAKIDIDHIQSVAWHVGRSCFFGILNNGDAAAGFDRIKTGGAVVASAGQQHANYFRPMLARSAAK